MADKKHVVIWDNGAEYSAHTIYFIEVDNSTLATQIAAVLEETSTLVLNGEDYDGSFDVWGVEGGHTIGIVEGLFLGTTCGLEDIINIDLFLDEGWRGRHSRPDKWNTGALKIWAMFSEILNAAWSEEDAEYLKHYGVDGPAYANVARRHAKIVSKLRETRGSI